MTMNGRRSLGAMILRGDRNLTLAQVQAQHPSRLGSERSADLDFASALP